MDSHYQAMDDCVFFLKGRCNNGNLCKYRHPTNLHEPVRVCKYWLTASCTNHSCKYLHGKITFVKPVTTKEQLSTHNRYGTNNYSRELSTCRFFKAGMCKNENCQFIHDDPSLTAVCDTLVSDSNLITSVSVNEFDDIVGANKCVVDSNCDPDYISLLGVGKSTGKRQRDIDDSVQGIDAAVSGRKTVSLNTADKILSKYSMSTFADSKHLPAITRTSSKTFANTRQEDVS